MHVAARKAPGFAAAAVAILALALPAATGAVPTWLAPQTISGPGIYRPHVAVDPAGDAVAAWIQVSGSTYTVMAASRPAGGTWGTPVPIGTPGPEQYKCELCSDPQVGMDSSGRAFAVWSWYDSAHNRRQIVLRSRSASGVWGRFALVLSTIPRPIAQRLAVSPSGDLAVVWNAFDNVHDIVQGWFRPAAGTYYPVQTISAPGVNAYRPEVAIDGAGNVVATWERSVSGIPKDSYIDTSYRPAAGPWRPATPLSAVGGYEHQVAMSSAGDAVATWSRVDGSNLTRVEAALRPAGGAWGAGVPISAPRAGGAFVQDPRVAVGPAGAAFAVWTGYNGSNAIIQSASRTAGVGGGWSAAQNLSAPGANATGPQLAVGANGTAVASWQRGAQTLVQAAARTAAGAWSSPQTISTTDTTASASQIAADATGNAVAVWPGSDGANSHVRAAGLDASGPAFNGLAIPSSGKVGKQLSFGASPFDIWSALGPGPVWSFGDGGSGAGNAVTHAYAKAGIYKVTLTQADAVGNTSTASRQLTITAAPPAAVHCVVPKVVGKALAKAKTALKRNHCRTGKLTRAYSKQIKKGRVLRQKPKARTKLRNGAKVALVVSRGKRLHR